MLAAFFVVRRVGAGRAGGRDTLGLLWGLCVAGLAAAFWVGLVRRRLLIGHVLAQLTGRLSDGVDVGRAARRAARRRCAIRRSRCSSPTGRCDGSTATGRSVGRLPAGAGRAVTIIRDEHGVSVVALDPRAGAARGRRSCWPRSARSCSRPSATTTSRTGSRRPCAARAVPAADRRGRGPRARPDRARPPRRRPAAADDAADQALAGRGAAAHRPAGGRRRTARAGHGGRAHARRAAGAGARRLPGDPQRPWARGGAAQPRRRGADPDAPADDRAHPPADGDRDRGLLHVPGSGPERGQACAGGVRRLGAGQPGPDALVRGARRRPGVHAAQRVVDGRCATATGLRNMRDRLEAVGGSLSIDSAPARDADHRARAARRPVRLRSARPSTRASGRGR